MDKQTISPEQFVAKWLEAQKEGKNQTWIGEQLGISRQAVALRAAYYRRKGVKLRTVKNTPLKLKVEELNKMIEIAGNNEND